MSFPRIFVCLWTLGVFFSCGDDDEPDKQVILRVPSEYANLADALAAAEDGATIRIDAPSVALDSTLVVGRGLRNVTILGRENGAGPRPVLVCDVTGRVAIDLSEDAFGVALVGVEMRGDYSIGARVDSEGGRVSDCRIEGASSYGVDTTEPASGVSISNNLIVAAGLFGVHCVGESRPEVTNNTIVDTQDCGIFMSGAAPVCENNIIENSANYGIACFGMLEHVIACNDIFNSVTAHFSSVCDPVMSNFHVDPLFCDREEFALQEDSPCLGVDDCGDLGAIGAACKP